MTYRKNAIAIMLFLFCAFFLFIVVNERHFSNKTQQDVDHHALVVASSVWTLFTPVTEEYLTLSVRNNQYQHLHITSLGDVDIFSYTNELTGFERVLANLGLIRTEAFQAPVIYDGKKIGRLEVTAYNKNIYLYSYVAVLLLLIGLLSWFINLIYDERKNLQIRVVEKTAELADNNLKLQAEIDERIRSEQTFHTLFDNSFQFIALLDPDCRVRKINQTALEFRNLQPADVLNRFFWDTPWWQHSETLISQLKFAHAQAKTGQIARFEAHSTAVKDIYLDITMKPVLNDQQQVIYIIAEARDITDLRHAEQELQQAQKMESIGTLAGGIAHDFNNILGGILGTLNLLKLKRRKGLPLPEEKLDQYLDTIDDAAQRASSMVKQLLTLSRKYDLEFKPLDLRPVLENVCQICRTTFDKSISIETNIDRQILVKADANSLEQVFLNVCINAAHAMTIMRPKGENWGGTLRITASETAFMQQAGGKSGPFWKIAISDTGVGIEEKDKDHLFIPFFTTKAAHAGTGLGLSMAFNILRQHSGFIEIDSHPGSGTCVSLYLPVCNEKLPLATDSEDVELVSGEGLILVIDDEEMIRNNAVELLSECGYQTITASNGRIGIDIYRRHQETISAVLLDLVMPEISGKETFLALKEINSDVKVLLSSGFRRDARVDEILAAGAEGFIQKPYSMVLLSKAIRKLLA